MATKSRKEELTEILTAADIEVEESAEYHMGLCGIFKIADPDGIWTFHFSVGCARLGAYSEDHFLPEEVMNKIEELIPGVRRAEKSDKKLFPNALPIFVIDPSNPLTLWAFLIAIQVLWVNDHA